MMIQIAEYDRPHRFVDVQVSGPFRRWRHEHHFAPDANDPSRTIMRDVVEFDAPAGVAGSVVAAMILGPYLQRLIGRRNGFLVDHLGR